LTKCTPVNITKYQVLRGVRLQCLHQISTYSDFVQLKCTRDMDLGKKEKIKVNPTGSRRPLPSPCYAGEPCYGQGLQINRKWKSWKLPTWYPGFLYSFM